MTVPCYKVFDTALMDPAAVCLVQACIAFPYYDLVLLSIPNCTDRLSCPFSIAQSPVHVAYSARHLVLA
jgi:hypothetical protein